MMHNKNILLSFFQLILFEIIIISFIVITNVTIDASCAIQPQYDEMASLSLAGNIVTQPKNYNERAYQVSIVENMEKLPQTIVIGSSRGMYLGTDTTGYLDIYNNCVSGACIEDYYALLGLYYNKFSKLPPRIIIETSPWVFYKDNPESKWQDNKTYEESAHSFYQLVNGKEMYIDDSILHTKKENPYISISYFRYNIEQLISNGFQIKRDIAQISTNTLEPADYPDGTIRYPAESENESPKRLLKVTSAKGACKCQNSHLMTEVDREKATQYENLIKYLQNRNIDVIIYLQPFSETQCSYSFDKGLNPGYPLAEQYINNYAKSRNIPVYGSYDARKCQLSDNRFIDYMHLDKKGTYYVWNSQQTAINTSNK